MATYVPDYLRVIAEQTAAAKDWKSTNAKNIKATGASTGEAARFANLAPKGTKTKAPTPTSALGFNNKNTKTTKVTVPKALQPVKPVKTVTTTKPGAGTPGNTGNLVIPEFFPEQVSVAVKEQVVPVPPPKVGTPGNTGNLVIPELFPEQVSVAVGEQVIPDPTLTPTPVVVVPDPVTGEPVIVPVPGAGEVVTDPGTGEVVTDPGTGEAGSTETGPAPTPYNVYDDPFYQQALAAAQSQFNLDRINALAGMQYQQLPIQRQLDMRPQEAEAARRRLAGNFASRGMAGGRYGALTRAEAQANARELSARTGLREQIAELGRQFTSQFGAEGTDWLGTRRGMEAQQSALQAALQNRLAGLTTIG